jgi:redox-sensitive bicupin YhaK (pirin superfamily)
MTAASGVLHEEKHSTEFTRRGGVLEMAQLWVNLPAREKMTPPRYQELPSGSIPMLELPDRFGSVRVIAGQLYDTPGAARTVTPVILWDARLRGGATATLPLPEGCNAAVFVRKGVLRLGDGPAAQTGQLVILERSGDAVSLSADEPSDLLVIGGEPIDEPMVAAGPFVMNTPDEIRQAIQDTRAGRLGSLG